MYKKLLSQGIHGLCFSPYEEGIEMFYFSSFDEAWKGSPEPNEPEKHWGLFTVDRKPKKVMQGLFH